MNKLKDRILVTGCSGFIGKRLCEFLLDKNYQVVGIDKNDCDLKNVNFSFIKQDLIYFFDCPKVDHIIHLAAKAGVKDSINNPIEYYLNNIQSFENIINISKKLNIKKLLFASSSSIYGDNINQAEFENKFMPMSPYAITKCINEYQADTARKNYNLSIVSLRFFNVYGPNIRADMAGYIFMEKILNNQPITIFGKNVKRDFTYIDDVVNSIYLILINGKNKCYNIGKSNPDNLIDYIKFIESNFNKKAIINYEDKNYYEPLITQSNCKLLESELSYIPKTSLENGTGKMCRWFLNKI
jgi:UDP-glucuronate 4-epimerase